MEEKKWLDCRGRAEFPIGSSDPELGGRELKGTSYNLIQRGFKITENTPSDSTFSENLVVSPHYTYENRLQQLEHCVLNSRNCGSSLELWKTNHKCIEDKVFQIENSNAQVARPTKYALSLVRGILSAVAEIHAQDHFLSYPVSYNINTISEEEIEVVIKEQENEKLSTIARFETDYEELDKLIFENILNISNITFTNLSCHREPPRLPIDLEELRMELKRGGRKNLYALANHFCLKSWEFRMKEIKGQFDSNLCSMLSSAATQLAMQSWQSDIPRQGVLQLFLQNPTSNISMRVRPYGRGKLELLRYMRNLFVHVKKQSYCTDDYKDSEYVEMMLSETFHRLYFSFF